MFSRRTLLIAVPFLWLLVLFALPLARAFLISFSQTATAIPPYLPVLEPGSGWGGGRRFLAALGFDSYRFLASDSLYWKAYVSSLGIAFRATLLTLLVGFPIAYGIARATDQWRSVLLMTVILPFWTSFLIRIYSWVGILSNEGILNQILMGAGLIDTPLVMLNTPFAVYLGITYAYLPLMVLPLYATLERLDASLVEAAQDLGCSKTKAFGLVTLPLSRLGIAAGCFLVFIPAIGEYVTPTLLGGSSTLMIGKVLFDEFFTNQDWPIASAVAVILLALLILPIVLFQRVQDRITAEDRE